MDILKIKQTKLDKDVLMHKRNLKNQAKIKAAHEVAMCKEALAKARQETLKKVIPEEKEAKKKKKVNCRADTVKARELPAQGQIQDLIRGGPKIVTGLNCQQCTAALCE